MINVVSDFYVSDFNVIDFDFDVNNNNIVFKCDDLMSELLTSLKQTKDGWSN